jgi:tRNA-splicing ligase RtcB
MSPIAPRNASGEMGTLGSGNHYLEVQAVAEIFDAPAALAFELAPNDVVVTIHCGSRGLGHQIEPNS